ncbi:hypothetical protein EDD11_008050 [Mortierella claussenii]|nr:hypothetical protein EDD11_008050 [Mortierella claussenii]
MGPVVMILFELRPDHRNHYNSTAKEDKDKHKDNQKSRGISSASSMAVKRSKKPTSKRRRMPVTTAVTASPTATLHKSQLSHASTTASDPLSVLMSLTPSGVETTSTTSSLLTVKSSKAVARKKSSLATAQLIRRYHTLNKELSKCLARIDSVNKCNDVALTPGGHTRSRQFPQDTVADLTRIAEIRQEMDDLGGLDMYQKASTLGQSKQRGGDSSKWLIPILENCHPRLDKKNGPALRLLDIGALSPHNYQRYTSWIHTTSIDLNPQDPLIIKMDFLDMPIPSGPDSLFNVVCLSLVINFVGDPAQRGEILRHSTRFLVPGSGILYLVLPLPCIQNSRYMDHELLLEMMHTLGYTTLVSYHFAKKLAYYAFRLDASSKDSQHPSKKTSRPASRQQQSLFPKKLRHDKPNRNKYEFDKSCRRG